MPSRGCRSRRSTRMRELVDRAADRAARAGRVLDQEPGRLRAALERPLAAPARRVRGPPRDPRRGGSRRGRRRRRPRSRSRRPPCSTSGGHRLLVDLVVGRGEVDEVEGVADHAADPRLGSPLLEALEVRRVVVRRAPRARALGEHLDRLAADRLGPVDRRVDPAGGRDVGAELHRATATTARSSRVASAHVVIVRPAAATRRCPSASASLRARPASSTSAACAPRSSTGSSRATRAASSCSGSRTRTTSREVDESVGADPGVAPLARSRLGRDGRPSSSTGWSAHQEVARRLVAEGKAYEDEGAIRFRMPDEGTTAWEDLVRGRIEFPNEKLEDLVAVRARRPPDLQLRLARRRLLDGDHARHPRRGPRLEHAEADPDPRGARRAAAPSTRISPNIFGPDGRKLSKRHGAVSVEEFRRDGYYAPGAHELPRAARLELRRPDDVFSARRARPPLHARPGRREPGHVRLREARVDERRLPARAAAGRVRGRARSPTCASRASSGTRSSSARAAPLVQEKIATLGEFPASPASSSSGSSPTRRCSTASGPSCGGARGARGVEPFDGRADRGGAPRSSPRLGLKPRAGLPADPRRGHRLEGLAGPLRVDRAPRPRGDARAPRAPRGSQRRRREVAVERGVWNAAARADGTRLGRPRKALAACASRLTV